jgi:yecA family protein
MAETLPQYQQVADALAELQAIGGAAETHGLLCALLSGQVLVRREAWLESMLTKPVANGDVAISKACKILIHLYDATQAALSAEDYDLQLLLPDDETPFEARIAALVEWVQGFLSGLNAMGITVDKEEGEVGEALKDLGNLACLEYEDEVGDEEGEGAYAELVEYTRMAAILLYDELRARFAAKATIKGNKTVH